MQFYGEIRLDPPLSNKELIFLKVFSERRHDAGRGKVEEGKPSLYCDWVPSADGKGLVWNGKEKFYMWEEWMRYLVDNFLKIGHTDQSSFLQGHHVSGEIVYQGYDIRDRWMLSVSDDGFRKERLR